jgi:two-component system chemotaxis response regulator CheY
MRCLVVDDSATMRRIFRNALREIGCEEILEAGDGKEAIERCNGGVDAIITDWNMPVMGGIELVRHLRGNTATAAIPVLMVTARNVKEDVMEAAQAGVTAYMLKPFTPETLRLKIEELLQPLRDARARPAEAA